MAEIYWIEADEENDQHLARHGLSIADVWEMIYERHITRPNPEAKGRILLTGQTIGGRVLTVSLEPTGEAGTWRPITGWPATPEETNLLKRSVR